MSQFHSIENTLAYVKDLTRLYEKHIEQCEVEGRAVHVSEDISYIIRKVLNAQTYHRTKSFSKMRDSALHEKIAYMVSLTVREYNCLHVYELSNSLAHLKIAKDVLQVLQNTQANTVLRGR